MIESHMITMSLCSESYFFVYYNWVMENMIGHNATMKRNDYGFSLVILID